MTDYPQSDIPEDFPEELILEADYGEPFGEIQQDPLFEDETLDVSAHPYIVDEDKRVIRPQGQSEGLNETYGTSVWRGATQVLVAGTTISPIASIVPVSAAGAITLTSNPNIAAGVTGQLLTLEGTSDTNTITLTDGNGIKINCCMVLGLYDQITFQYNGSYWIELNRSIVSAPMGEVSYFDMTGTSIAIAAQSDGSSNMVKVNPTTTLSSLCEDFDNGGANDGRLRYTGRKTKLFHVACTISLAPSAAADTFVFGVAKGGTVIAASKVLYKVLNAGDTRSTALHVFVQLATNEYLELYVGNTTDADDLTIKSVNLFAMGMDT